MYLCGVKTTAGPKKKKARCDAESKTLTLHFYYAPLHVYIKERERGTFVPRLLLLLSAPRTNKAALGAWDSPI